MAIFTLKKFVEIDRSSDLVKWYDGLGEEGKAKFAVRMEYLTACNTPAEWVMPYCKFLSAGIIEIRFIDRRVQQRPLGYFGPNTKEFSFLYPAKEKGGEFIPRDAIARAVQRKELVKADPRRSNDWNIGINQ